MDQKRTREEADRAGIVVRMLAGSYDLMILIGVAFIAFIPVSMAESQFGESPDWLKQLLLTILVFAYLSGFWVKGGATTGMRPWRLQVAMVDTGNHPTLSMAVVRCFCLSLTWLAFATTLMYMAMRQTNDLIFFLSASIPAISLCCMLLTPQRQALHDVLAGTSVYRLHKKTA